MSEFGSGFNSENSFDELNNLQEDIKKYRTLIEKGEIYNSVELVEDLIDACHENELFDEAIFFIERLIEIAPYNSDYWVKKGIFLNRIIEPEMALDCFEKALSLNPADIEALIEKSLSEQDLLLFQEAQTTLDSALMIDPNNEEVLYNLGLLLQQLDGKLDEAVSCFKKVLKINPDYSDAYYELGYCNEQKGNFKEALKAYESFIDLEPYNPSGWYNRGIILGKLNNIEKSIESYDLAISINDNFISAWFNKGNALADLGRYEQAIECFRKAYSLDPTDEASCFNIANVYEELGDLVNAIKYYTEAVKINKYYYEAYLARGFCYDSAGKFYFALRDFNKAISLSQDSADAWFAKADLEYSLGKLQDAASSYKEALKIEPGNYEINFNLAETLFETGLWLEALKEYDKCILLNPVDAPSYYGKAKINFILSRTKEAIECLKAAFRIDPSIRLEFAKEYPEIKSSKLFKKLLGEG